MELIPGEFAKPKAETPKTNAFRYWTLGVIVVVLLAAAGIVYYGLSVLGKNLGAAGNGGSAMTPKTRQQLVNALSTQSSTTTVVSAADRQKLIDAMSQQTSSTTASTTASAPAISAADRQKLIDAMQQKK